LWMRRSSHGKLVSDHALANIIRIGAIHIALTRHDGAPSLWCRCDMGKATMVHRASMAALF
jgi:hypothetical protein